MSAPGAAGVTRVHSTTRSCFGSPEATPCLKLTLAATAEPCAAAGVAAPRPSRASAFRRSILMVVAPQLRLPDMTQPYHRSMTLDVEGRPARPPRETVSRHFEQADRKSVDHRGAGGGGLVSAARRRLRRRRAEEDPAAQRSRGAGARRHGPGVAAPQRSG